MDKEQVVQLLRKRLEEEGAVALAKRLGVTRQAIWAVLCGKWDPGSKLLQSLGLVETRVIQKKLVQHKKNFKHSAYKRAGMLAHRIVEQAVMAGLLPNLRIGETMCSDCMARIASVYDHRDYSKPLEVSPVCGMCNVKRGPAIMSKERPKA